MRPRRTPDLETPGSDQPHSPDWSLVMNRLTDAPKPSKQQIHTLQPPTCSHCHGCNLPISALQSSPLSPPAWPRPARKAALPLGSLPGFQVLLALTISSVTHYADLSWHLSLILCIPGAPLSCSRAGVRFLSVSPRGGHSLLLNE